MSEPIHHIDGMPVGAAHAKIEVVDYDGPAELWCGLCEGDVLSPVGDLEQAVQAWDAHRRECAGAPPAC